MLNSRESFNSRIDNILREESDPEKIEEGMILSVNKLISTAIRVPEGEYIIAVVNADNCVLVPTSEASGEKFEVFKPTLAGFFNPEIHKKIIEPDEGSLIAES